jgi:hypothetical protein
MENDEHEISTNNIDRILEKIHHEINKHNEKI